MGCTHVLLSVTLGTRTHPTAAVYRVTPQAARVLGHYGVELLPPRGREHLLIPRAVGGWPATMRFSGRIASAPDVTELPRLRCYRVAWELASFPGSPSIHRPTKCSLPPQAAEALCRVHRVRRTQACEPCQRATALSGVAASAVDRSDRHQGSHAGDARRALAPSYPDRLPTTRILASKSN